VNSVATVTVSLNAPSSYVNTITLLDTVNGYLTVKQQVCEPALIIMGTHTAGRLVTITEGQNVVGFTVEPASELIVTMPKDALPTSTVVTIGIYCHDPRFTIYTLKEVTVTYNESTVTVLPVTIPKVVTATYQTLAVQTAIDGSTYVAPVLTSSIFTTPYVTKMTSVVTAGATRIYKVPVLMNTTSYPRWAAIRIVTAYVTLPASGVATVSFPMLDKSHWGELLVNVVGVPAPALLAAIAAALRKARGEED
jgi:hypothetical protein